MSGKKKSGSARAVPRAYGRLTRHERDTVQRMLERRASCREIARELGRSPSTVSAEVGVAQVRDGAEGQARRARGRLRRPVGGLPAPGGVAAMLQRLRPVPRDRLQAPPPRLLRGPGRAAVRRLGPRLVQARDRRRRARRGGQAGGDKGLPAPGAVARADGGAQRRPGGPVAVDHLPLGLGGLRRHDQHGAQAQGRLQAEEARRGPGGDPPLRPAGRMPRSSPSGRTRAPRPGRWTPSRGPGRTPPACSRCCTAPAGSSSRCRWRRRPPGASRTPWGASGPSSAPTGRAACSAPSSPTTAPSSPTRRRSRRCSARGRARRGCSTATPGAATRRAPASATTSRSGSCCQGRRNQVRPARPGRPGAGHVARELRAPRRARLRDARARLQGDARGGRGGAAGRLRRGGRAHRGTRPDAGAHREGARREGRCPAGLA